MTRTPTPTYTITAINLGNMIVDRSQMIYETGMGTKVTIPTFTAAIEGNGVKLLVDTGISDPAWVESEMVPCWVEKDETLEGALGEIGWKTTEIDIVINTHLHHDHCANNVLLTNAEFYASAPEWEYSTRPLATQRVLYNKAWLEGDLNHFRYTLIDHDFYDVLPGIRVIKTPGHTPGHQSVLVNTVEGVVCVTGDIVNDLDSFRLDSPCGIHTSVADSLASLQKIRTHADRVLMNHDRTVSKFQSGSFPIIPTLETAAKAGR